MPFPTGVLSPLKHKQVAAFLSGDVLIKYVNLLELVRGKYLSPLPEEPQPHWLRFVCLRATIAFRLILEQCKVNKSNALTSPHLLKLLPVVEPRHHFAGIYQAAYQRDVIEFIRLLMREDCELYTSPATLPPVKVICSLLQSNPMFVLYYNQANICHLIRRLFACSDFIGAGFCWLVSIALWDKCCCLVSEGILSCANMTEYQSCDWKFEVICCEKCLHFLMRLPFLIICWGDFLCVSLYKTPECNQVQSNGYISSFFPQPLRKIDFTRGNCSPFDAHDVLISCILWSVVVEWRLSCC